MLQMLFRMAYLELYSLMFNTGHGKHILKGYNNMFISKLMFLIKKKKKKKENPQISKRFFSL